MLSLHLGDCREILPQLAAFDWIITDPPYPDNHVELYDYSPDLITQLDSYNCPQLVFWTAREEFPLSFSCVHIWDKKTGVASQYERIFQRNGGGGWMVFRHYLINSTVAASFTGDQYTGHKSQKPLRLMLDLIERFTKPGDTICDPFMGSGSTGVACGKLGRNFIGIEKNPTNFYGAKTRVEQAFSQLGLFNHAG